MKEWYSAAELAGLPGCAQTKSGVIRQAKRDVWESRPRKARGGGLEYLLSSLPKETQQHLRILATREEHKALMILPAAEAGPLSDALDNGEECRLVVRPPKPPREVTPNADLADWQREIRDARIALVGYVGEHFPGRGGPRHFEAALDAGALPAPVIDLCRRANARAGDGRLVSAASLYRWDKDLRLLGPDALAPGVRPPALRPDWLGPVLTEYQKPSKPTLAAAVREARKAHPAAEIPPLRTIQHHVAELPMELREWGRMGARAIRSIRPFVRRTTDGLWPMDVVTVDGHMAKCYVRRPDTGRRIRPELTAYMDIATRKVLGWSAWWAESQYAIWLAMRAMVLHPEQGVPAIQYSDNGAYRADGHRAVLGRLGITPMYAQAYRAQARGAIERLNSSLWVPLAKTQPTYCGKDADAEKFKQALVRADKDGRGLLDWGPWLAAIATDVAEYNARPHSALKRGRETLSPSQAWAMACEEGWRPTLLEAEDLHDLLPFESRKCLRGAVSLPWGVYAHELLRLQSGRPVRVHYDPADGARVWVADSSGRVLCVAQRDANAKPYVPESALEHAREKREEGRVGRLEARIAGVRQDETPLLDLTVVREGETYDLPDLKVGRGLIDQDPAALLRAEAAAERVLMTMDIHPIDRLSSDPERYAHWQVLDARRAAGEALDAREESFWVAVGESSYCRTKRELDAQFEAAFMPAAS